MKRTLMLALVALGLQGCDGDLINVPTSAPAQLPTPVPPGPMPSPVPDTNRPPHLVANFSSRVERGSVTGRAPFKLDVSLCNSTDPDGDQTSYRYIWGDGIDHSSFSCVRSNTYLAAGQYDATFCIYDRPEFHYDCRGLIVVVTN